MHSPTGLSLKITNLATLFFFFGLISKKNSEDQAVEMVNKTCQVCNLPDGSCLALNRVQISKEKNPHAKEVCNLPNVKFVKQVSFSWIHILTN